MVPLTILKIYKVPNAKLAEEILFCALDEYRVVENHEVFDVTPGLLGQAFECVKEAFDAMTRINLKLPVVEEVDISSYKRGKNRRYTNEVSVNQIRKIEAAERRQARVKAYEEKQDEIKHCSQTREEEIDANLKKFIENKCEVGNDKKEYRALSSEMLQAFNKTYQVHMYSKAFNSKMKDLGFAKKQVRIGQHVNSGYEGIRLIK